MICGAAVKEPSRQQAPERASASAQTDVKPRPPDERIADYTLWLERFTGLLVVVAGIEIALLFKADRAMARNITAAQTAADAALRSAIVAERNLQISVRPVIVGSEVLLRDGRKPRHIVFNLANAGSGPAVLRGVQAHGTIKDAEGSLKFSFGSIQVIPKEFEGATIEADDLHFGPIECPVEVLDDDANLKMIRDGLWQLSVRFVVSADDILGNSGRHVDIFDYETAHNGWMRPARLPKR